MSKAPLTRDLQTQFVTEAAKRREERISRWSKNEQLRTALREPAQAHNVTETYARSDLQQQKYG